jgi:hypothetical protein
MSLVAIAVRLFHLSIIAFVIIAPFTNFAPVLVVHILFTLLLMMHWATNNNVCFLTEVEAYFRGADRTTTFMHSVLEPIYIIKDNHLNYLIWVSTITLCIYSIYVLSQNKNAQESIQKMREGNLKEAFLVFFRN